MTNLSSGLSSVPATAWVGILAFVGTVLTIAWNNRAAEKRALQQAKDNRESETARRLYEGRRAVFERAAEVAAQGVTLIAQMADFDRETSDITAPFIASAGSLAKVHLFSSFNTSRSIVGIGREIGTAVVELTIERVPIEQFVKHVATLPQTQELARQRLAQAEQRLQFSERCMERSMALMPSLGAALEAIRSDLGVASGSESYSEMLKAQAQQQLAHFARAISSLREVIRDNQDRPAK